jgi:fructose-1,6-bisphosphatase I
VNDGRYFEWPPGLREYVDTIRQGRGQNPRRYSAKHISSLVPDLHRTILYGGIAMNPRAQLRLVHEANALSFLVENAGGRAIDGRRRILEIQPTHLHQRLPLFLGSRADVSEVESYGDIQQVIQINPVYGDEEDDDGDDYDYN